MLNVKPEGFLMGHMDTHKYTYGQAHTYIFTINGHLLAFVPLRATAQQDICKCTTNKREAV